MSSLKATLDYLTGKVYVPEEALHLKGSRLLHISDTPASFYPGLRRLLQALKPDYIVHTGDLADNIKLQLYPLAVPRYEKTVQPLLKMLSESGAKAVYVAVGNHDHLETLKKYSNNLTLIPCQDFIELEGRSLSISHFPKVIAEHSSEVNFFGHNLFLETQISNDCYFFNGISHIHLIDLASMEVVYLSYPWGTDDHRLGKGRVGF